MTALIAGAHFVSFNIPDIVSKIRFPVEQATGRYLIVLADRHGKATTLIVSHRISTVSNADKILVLEDGRITQSGTHAELARQPGLYSRICAIQDELVQEIGEAERVSE